MPHPLDDLRALTPHTIQTVCKAAGITKQSWYNLKRIKRGAYATTVFGLAAALATTPEAIMDRLCPRSPDGL